MIISPSSSSTKILIQYHPNSIIVLILLFVQSILLVLINFNCDPILYLNLHGKLIVVEAWIVNVERVSTPIQKIIIVFELILIPFIGFFHRVQDFSSPSHQISIVVPIILLTSYLISISILPLICSSSPVICIPIHVSHPLMLNST